MKKPCPRNQSKMKHRDYLLNNCFLLIKSPKHIISCDFSSRDKEIIYKKAFATNIFRLEKMIIKIMFIKIVIQRSCTGMTKFFTGTITVTFLLQQLEEKNRFLNTTL